MRYSSWPVLPVTANVFRRMISTQDSDSDTWSSTVLSEKHTFPKKWAQTPHRHTDTSAATHKLSTVYKRQVSRVRWRILSPRHPCSAETSKQSKPNFLADVTSTAMRFRRSTLPSMRHIERITPLRPFPNHPGPVNGRQHWGLGQANKHEHRHHRLAQGLLGSRSTRVSAIRCAVRLGRPREKVRRHHNKMRQ